MCAAGLDLSASTLKSGEFTRKASPLAYLGKFVISGPSSLKATNG